MSKVERRLAAILVADVVGYSRLMNRDEEGTQRRVKALLNELMRPKIAEHNGRVMKTTGDGMLAEFSSVFEAFHCAVEIQDVLQSQNEGLAAADRMDVRMGLNMGDVIFDDGDFFGDGVNIAARLEPLSPPGGICVSSRAWEDLRRLNLDFKDIGEQHLKNIDQPVRAYSLAAAHKATVFMPARAPSPAEPADPTVAHNRRAADTAPPPPVAAPTVVQPRAPAPPPEGTMAPGAHVIRVGDVLNHIFEVTRFIARGGMGEVYEGKNVNSDERVAIKVILPALASDERVIAMFQREARTLTRLQHSALVQYRVLAKEPRLGVLYIVTEYIDGINLSDMLKTRKPTADELIGLLRRLASGLSVAHSLGAIHRDMSPDNVLLPDGKLREAKIIDFGIAKDLDTSQATIVGDGFAGKLNYVAPEQLGDFGREIGPWTDVYSLALVIIAVASGDQVKMGRTLVEAVDKRRAEVDLSLVPEKVRPVLTAMLRPDPKDRLRSMEEVLERLDDPVTQIRTVIAPAPAEATTGKNKGLLIGGGVLALLVAIGLAIFLLRPGAPEAGKGGQGSAPVAAGPAARDIVQAARDAIDSTVPSISCSWLDISELGPRGSSVQVRMTGAAGDPPRAQTQVARALEASQLPNASIDFDQVVDITPGGCSALDAFRQVRDSEGGRLSVAQREWKMTVRQEGPYAGKPAATAVVTIRVGDPNLNFAIVGIEPSGAITKMSGDRAEFDQLRARAPDQIVEDGQDSYRLSINLDHVGWSGVVLFTGKGPFPLDVISPSLGARGPDWVDHFVRVASDQQWKTDMIWFKSVE